MKRRWKRTKGANLNDKLSNEHHLKSSDAECYFRNLEDHLVEFIRESESVVICMAWLTNQKVLKELLEKPCVLILQNETWLNKKGGLAKKARDMYQTLRERKDKVVLDKSVEKTRIITDIRVCGMISHPQNMHHKFVVRIQGGIPTSVWTGSFNPTTNGNESIENALVIHNEQIARAYFQEFLSVKAISKPLKI